MASIFRTREEEDALQILTFQKRRDPEQAEQRKIITGVRRGCFDSCGAGTMVVVAQGKLVEGAAEGIYLLLVGCHVATSHDSPLPLVELQRWEVIRH